MKILLFSILLYASFDVEAVSNTYGCKYSKNISAVTKKYKINIPDGNGGYSEVKVCNLKKSTNIYIYSFPLIDKNVCYVKAFAFIPLKGSKGNPEGEVREYYSYNGDGECRDYSNENYIDLTYLSQHVDRVHFSIMLNGFLSSFRSGNYDKYMGISIYDVFFSKDYIDFKREIMQGKPIYIKNVIRSPLSSSDNDIIITISLGENDWDLMAKIENGKIVIKKLSKVFL
ncbi:hypothetical protein [Gallaecimonas mangrovi]|uniref:hypothetical protein n=1 Tax=Gallaecimonas mangrovi TaxID=2291597 RepID=UPI0012603827|nr:hypothetical protein [Gallaecimonas mangrovi]